jgi:hypothetical protein
MCDDEVCLHESRDERRTMSQPETSGGWSFANQGTARGAGVETGPWNEDGLRPRPLLD